MKPALCDFEYLAIPHAAKAINQPVLLCNTSRPETFEIVLKRFGLASTSKRMALTFFDQSIEFSKRFRIIIQQSQIVLPSPR